jgi:hypothetical protein
MKKTLLIMLIGFMGISLYAQTEFEAKFKDLPKDTQKYISKNFDGWAVDKCMMSENAKGKMTSCDVFVSKGTEKLKVVFDKDGEYVKREPVTEAAPAAVTPAAAPAAVTPAAAPAVAPAAAAPVVEPAVAPVAVPDTTNKPK